MSNTRQLTITTALLSAVTVASLTFYGAWQRRWMSDDGLIVLRTVRNLLAGNGPVFNAGERVEANTSTLWQYVIYVVALFSDARLEHIALWLSLIFTTAAVLIAALATAKLHNTKNWLLVPFGLLIYIALPPARDFATSGLEWGLSLFWIAVQWMLLVTWSQNRNGKHVAEHSQRITYILAFWSGLSWLVRPELALYGGLTGILLLVSAPRFRVGLGILAAALPIPAAYQIFRMGFYGLIVPHTAVAKSASGSEWSKGWGYVEDFTSPYNLYIALGIAVAAGAVLVATTSTTSMSGNGREKLRHPISAITLVLIAGTIHLLYVIRVGGDFMHGRMLLLPLFTLLLPVAVMRIWSPNAKFSWPAISSIGLFIGAIVWAGFTAAGGHEFTLPSKLEEMNIVDEREYWTQFAKRDSAPLVAEDFLTTRPMGDWKEVLDTSLETNSGQMVNILVQEEPAVQSWEPIDRTTEDTDLARMPLTATMMNLGMTSMNAPLDVRILDPVGLSNPLAARQPRIEDGRIGHDKYLPMEWQIADSAVDINKIPIWIDRNEAQLARWVLYTQDYRELFESYRAPLTRSQFLSNIKFSLTKGRTLEFSEDPWDYYDLLPVEPVLPIYWEPEIKTDEPRN